MESTQKDPLDAQSVNLPPDQSLRKITSKTANSFLLLSVSDAPIRIGKGSDYDNFSLYSKVHIFSESIAFTGDLLSQEGISIFCNDITSVSPAKINTTGKDGEDQKPTEPAKNGALGGPLNFYIQNGSTAASKSISFVAKGGAGGDNTTAEDAQAGNGGDGGHVVRIFQSNCSALRDSIYVFLARKDIDPKDPKHYESPVVKGDPIYYAASNLLPTAIALIAVEEIVKDLIKDLQKRLSDIDNGTTVTIHELVVTIRILLDDLEDKVVSKQEDNFKVSVEFGGGDPGSGKRGKTGKGGGSGSDIYWFQGRYDETIRKTTLAFAHPEQCTMLLERAKIFYYMGSPVLRAQAADLLQRIVHRLSFLPLKSNDPLYKAYTVSDIMPSDSLAQFDSIKTDAANLYTQLITGECYNGHEQNWTPRASYTFYKDALDSALVDHEAFEDAYIKYHAVLSKGEELQDSVGLALTQTSQLITGLKADIGELATQLRESNDSINALTVPVKATHTALMEEFKIVKKKVKKYFGLNFPQILNAIKSLVFASDKGMAAIDGLDFVYQGFTTIPSIDGTSINKDVVIGKIQYGEATVQSFEATLGKQLDGEFILDDPSATRIMTAEEDMMSFLDSFVNTSLAEVITEMKDKFNAFVKAILARNQEVLHYNILLKLTVKKLADKADYLKKKDDFQREKIKVTDPDLPAITAYMGDIYQSSRARVMKLLDNLVRSLNFRMLGREDIYNLAFSEGTEYDKVPLTLTSDVLRSARSRIEYKFSEKLWGSEPARFPAEFDDERGKEGKAHLSQDDPKKTLVVQIPPVYKETIEKNDFSGCCNVRIYRVRFGFTGLVAKETARVSVVVRHSGKEVIVSKDDSSYKFIHNAIKTVYSFNLHPDGTYMVLDNGNIGEADVGQPATSYAAPGPFTDWEIDLTNSDLYLLDFSNVSEAYFDFCGTNYAL
ncbi:hypothetical protein BYT27DRAFT_7237498 [Phlegmacium glaucopus]|nr:hypothetical protein BYT27DRAFT_7237498 [Phlegmacium glaucopus]